MTEDIFEHTLQNSKEQTHKIPTLIRISSYCAFLARKTNLPTWHIQTCLHININPHQVGACFLLLRIKTVLTVWLRLELGSSPAAARTAKCCCCGTAMSRVAAPWWCWETGVIMWLREADSQFLQRQHTWKGAAKPTWLCRKMSQDQIKAFGALWPG